jgi:hypothetical protein
MPPPHRPHRKGPRRVSSLVDRDVTRLSRTRGFGQSRLLTHWAEIAGPEMAAICRPVEVSYPRGRGLGATLRLLTTGARAPMLQMRLPELREKVNACYGYAAIGRIEITQTSGTGFAAGGPGFAEGQAAFDAGPARDGPRREVPHRNVTVARDLARGIHDPGLRASLERLGAALISRRRGSARADDDTGDET